MIDDPKTANAFALPGGKVAVYTGILPVTRDEAGLAAVLGHEVAHVLARHSAERISRQLALQLGVEWLGTATGVNPQLTQAGGAILVSAIQLPWGRAQESEADHLGLHLHGQGGLRPARRAGAVGRAWPRHPRAAPGRPEFLSTHPSEETRVQPDRRLAPRGAPLLHSAPLTPRLAAPPRRGASGARTGPFSAFPRNPR